MPEERKVKQLNDKRKKMIIADYVECENYSEVARKHGISRQGVKKIVEQNPNSAELLRQKKDSNTADVIAYMETKKGQVCELIDVYLTALLDSEKIKEAKVNQLSTALGTVIDKFTSGSANRGATATEDVIREIASVLAGDDKF